MKSIKLTILSLNSLQLSRSEARKLQISVKKTPTNISEFSVKLSKQSLLVRDFYRCKTKKYSP